MNKYIITGGKDALNYTKFTPIVDVNLKIKLIACGDEHIMIVDEDNNLWGMGENSTGALGLGHDDNVTQFTRIPFEGSGEIQHLVCSSDSTIVVTKSNEIWATGRNEFAQLILGTKETTLSFTKSRQRVLNGDKSVEMISMGTNHTFILLSGNELYACGSNEYSQLGLPEEQSYYLYLQRMNGENSSLAGKEIKQISCGGNHTAVLTTENELWMCGANPKGELGLGVKSKIVAEFTKVPTDLPVIKQIACGWSNHTALLTEDGKLYTCGGGLSGGLARSGTKSSFEVVPFEKSIDRLCISSSSDSTVVISGNEVYAAGKNTNHQLGYPDVKNRERLVKLPFHTNATTLHVVSGGYLTMVATGDEGELVLEEVQVPDVLLEEKNGEKVDEEQKKLAEKRNEAMKRLRMKRPPADKKTKTNTSNTTATTTTTTSNSKKTTTSGKGTSGGKVSTKSSVTSTIPRKNPNIR